MTIDGLMFIIDAHLDLAWNALQWNRDLQTSVYMIRRGEREWSGPGRGIGTVALPDMRSGSIGLCFATLLARSTGTPVQHLDYASPLQAYAVAQGQLAYYKSLAEMGDVRLIGNAVELDQHITSWIDWEAKTSLLPPVPGLVISMESADPILTPDQLPDWKEAGVRIIGPAHYGPGRYAGGTSTDLGLTQLGTALLREMTQLDILLDLTHLTDQGFWEALDRFDGRILASHNNCRTLVPHQRQFSDRQLRAIMERQGVVGVACDNWMLRTDWVRGANTNQPVHLVDVCNHIDHICQLAGNSRHAAIGSDLDGGFGREQSPIDLDTIADLQKILDILASRGYREEDVAAIAHGNWLRLLEESWAS